MNSKFSSNFETESLQEMTKTAIHSEAILINHLKKTVSDILWKSFDDYKSENMKTIATKNMGAVLGYGLKKIFGSYNEGEFSNNISRMSQLQSDIEVIKQQLDLISKMIPKMGSEKLFRILHINKKQGLLAAISYSLVVQIEVSKRV